MRIIFMGTPDFAVPTLRALAAAGHTVVAAYSQPPRPAGRGKKLQPSPVHLAAEALGIAVRTPASLKGAEEQAAMAALDADVAVVAAYGLILPQAVLDAPRRGCLNVHGSILPRWRGAAPVQRAILAGDEETGVCIMQMERGLDTGPVRLSRTWPIGFYDTAGKVTGDLARLGAAMIVEVLADLDSHPPVPQAADGVTYASKIDKAEARLDFTKGALHAHRQVRAFNPAPGAFFEVNGERIKVLEASIPSATPSNLSIHFPTDAGLVLDDQLAIGCGDGAIRPMLVQRAGRPAMAAHDLLRGFSIPVGTVLG
ncbi:methionyl-tRNA formyltransferase [Novosphingobium sp. MD-1]|uniref:methionyl-tRNA formyltransferase n=1 Tax=Novosphingobium sp. MD-1 TaxID=1630648 RepID=UPI00061C2642|nr:methionyl-tRNA formyltransferase [Novosphingobium sp. MD-1]GAO56726.1 methionyl-tRNA formyltransferase [Novosphingobium sp. MD-1]